MPTTTSSVIRLLLLAAATVGAVSADKEFVDADRSEPEVTLADAGTPTADKSLFDSRNFPPPPLPHRGRRDVALLYDNKDAIGDQSFWKRPSSTGNDVDKGDNDDDDDGSSAFAAAARHFWKRFNSPENAFWKRTMTAASFWKRDNNRNVDDQPVAFWKRQVDAKSPASFWKRDVDTDDEDAFWKRGSSPRASSTNSFWKRGVGAKTFWKRGNGDDESEFWKRTSPVADGAMSWKHTRPPSPGHTLTYHAADAGERTIKSHLMPNAGRASDVEKRTSAVVDRRLMLAKEFRDLPREERRRQEARPEFNPTGW